MSFGNLGERIRPMDPDAHPMHRNSAKKLREPFFKLLSIVEVVHQRGRPGPFHFYVLRR